MNTFACIIISATFGAVLAAIGIIAKIDNKIMLINGTVDRVFEYCRTIDFRTCNLSRNYNLMHDDVDHIYEQVDFLTNRLGKDNKLKSDCEVCCHRCVCTRIGKTTCEHFMREEK